MRAKDRGLRFLRHLTATCCSITIDTLRGDALGCDGGPARTPNLDSLAAGGIRFSFAHAQAVVTLPSHASILTGLYPFQHGYRENSGYRLTPGVQPLAARLKANGFSTGAFVAAFPLDARFGLTPGFDTYDGRFDDVGSGAEFLLPERPAPVVVERAVPVDPAARGTLVRVGARLRSARALPPAAALRSRVRRAAVLRRGRGGGPGARTAAGRRARLVAIDAGRGDRRSRRVARRARRADARPLRLRIDIARAAHRRGGRRAGGPGEAGRTGGAGGTGGSGETSDQPARHVDIVPTILDALALPVPADLPGHTLRTRADRDGGAARASYFEAMESMLDFGFAPLDGVLVGREKYIRLPLPELYDLATDRGERSNLVDRAGERARVLATRLTEFHAVGARERRSRSRPRWPPASARSATSRDRPRRNHTTASRTIRSGSSRSIA